MTVSLRSVRFRADAFACSIELYMTIRGLSMRRAADEMGVSRATVNRVTHGHTPDLDSYLRIRMWLEIQRQAYGTPRPDPI